MKQKSAVIGSGVAGIASAIRLAAKGYSVEVFEQAAAPGGKLSERRHGGFRFDTGPSLFTLPELVTELFEICGKDPRNYFSYTRLASSCRYFWENGTVINAWSDSKDFAREVAQKTKVPAGQIIKFLNKSRRLYELTNQVFVFNSLHKWHNFLQPAHRRSLFHLHELDVFTSMHTKNKRWFSDPKIVQLFDRYATYNGSNPYKTPATLNIIPHLEHNTGAFFPAKGMYQIVTSLTGLARDMGVQFHFNTAAKSVKVENNRVKGLLAGGKTLDFDLIVSDVDVVNLYRALLPGASFPKKQLSLERSSSALIFYWGINKNFPELSLHNILFSKDYQNEFQQMFGEKTIGDDPTVYLFISAREVPDDAPAGQENWYVMINVPENTGQNWDALVHKARKNIVEKIKRVLGLDIEPHIVSESHADPRSIETDTGSYRGALYGLSSNSRFAAFYRHPNFKKSIKNLYFTGGSVHPGGGIPLCLASARIIDKEIPSA